MKLDFMTIFGIVSLIASEVNDKYSDKKVTVGEAMEITNKLVSALNLTDKVLVDNSKEEE